MNDPVDQTGGVAISSSYCGQKKGSGADRHLQLTELLQRSEIPFRGEFDMMGDRPLKSQLLLGLAGWMAMRACHPWICAEIIPLAPCMIAPLLVLAGVRYLRWRRLLQGAPISTVILEDCWMGGQGTFLAARERGCRIVAVPHNVDSLAFPRISESRHWRSLRSELAMLRRCAATFAVSSSDAWLHRHFGIQSLILRHYPVGSRLAQLLRIRAARELKRATGGVLIAASIAGNTHSRRGIEVLLAGIARAGLNAHVSFDVMGRGTEDLRARFELDNVRFHGTVDDEEFARLGSECRCLIAFQISGSGALSRVIDSLIAGIPVVANPTGARSWESYAGVWVFESWRELGRILSLDFPASVSLPPRPTVEEQNFVDAIRPAAGANNQEP